MSKHVETHLAWRMRATGQTSASVVLNNDICDRKSPSLIAHLGCRRAVRAILPRGYTLTVYEQCYQEPIVIQGVAE